MPQVGHVRNTSIVAVLVLSCSCIVEQYVIWPWLKMTRSTSTFTARYTWATSKLPSAVELWLLNVYITYLARKWKRQRNKLSPPMWRNESWPASPRLLSERHCGEPANNRVSFERIVHILTARQAHHLRKHRYIKHAMSILFVNR